MTREGGGRSGWAGQLDRRAAHGLEWAKWAVERWSAFPVDEQPRPLVLVEPRVRAQHGFATAQAKLAFVEGLVESEVALPEGVIQSLRRGDDPSHSVARTALAIHGAALEEAEFMTDRGPLLLPAWRLSAQDALGVIWVLDPDAVDWRPAADAAARPPEGQGPGHRAGMPVEVADDDRTLLVHWLGGAPNFERYPSAQVIESKTAVSVVPVGEDIGPPGARTAVGHVHRVPALLREPLSARVLVDLNGNPQRVIRHGQPTGAAA